MTDLADGLAAPPGMGNRLGPALCRSARDKADACFLKSARVEFAIV
ncbi:hypothetical protein [Streptosporangium subroseum]|nr:hypothetical protein OHB15_44770 [Streptosporangium subroseum]